MGKFLRSFKRKGDRQPVQGRENTEQENAGNLPVVYMTTEISAESLMAVPGPIRQCTIRWRRHNSAFAGMAV